MQASNEIEVPVPARQAGAGGARGRAHGTGRPLRASAALAMLVGAATLAAACGGGGSGGSDASAAGSSSSPASNPAQFAQCMRSHGEPAFPDPNSAGKFSIQVTKGGSLDPQSATYQSALQACRKYDTSFGNPSANPGQAASALKFSKCMRSHGVTNFPDPGSNGAFIMTGNIQSNPHFQSAMQACRPLLSGGGSSASVSGGGS